VITDEQCRAENEETGGADEPLEYYGEPPETNAERLENGKVTPR
jgi:hypothetical protein